MSQLPTSPHFTLHEVSEGVYAALHAPGGWAQSNAGIIDLGDRTLVYDTFISPVASRDLLEATRALCGRRASLILNSHYHNDHTWGNLGIPADMDILSTFKTRQVLTRRDPREYEIYYEETMKSLAKMQTRLQNATTEKEKAHAQYFVVYFQAIVNTLPKLPARLANILTEDVIEFTGSKRVARFIPLSGHTGSDSILHLPEDKIVFLSDLLFVEAHPYLGDGHPDGLRQAIARIKELNAEVLVPGHGPLGRVEHLDLMLAYTRELEQLVQQALRDGISLQEVSRNAIPAEYDSWIFSNFYEENIEFLYELYSQ